CGADEARVHLVDGDRMRRLAKYGSLPDTGATESFVIDRGGRPGRAVLDRAVIHLEDVRLLDQAERFARTARAMGARTVLVAPMLVGDRAIGAVNLFRAIVQPFTEE